jgi:hypothetical protein
MIDAKRVTATPASTLLQKLDVNSRLTLRNTSGDRMVYIGPSPDSCLFGLRPRETIQLLLTAGDSIYVRSGGSKAATVEVLLVT